MIYSVQQIKFEILGHIKEFGSNFNDWFVGISSDPNKALFEQHLVDKKKDIWLYKQAVSFAACKTIQTYFIMNLKTDGSPVLDGSEDTDCIYLFKKSKKTKPSN
jgi:hypothetical protein